MNLKINKKKSQRNTDVSQSDDRLIVGILSPDRVESEESEVSINNNDSYDLDLVQTKHNKSQLT